MASKRLRAKRSNSQGVTVTATKNENSIAIEALAGMGLMYGPIMPAHEHHRQQRGDDGERRHDRRIADLRHRFDRGVGQAAAVAHRPVAGDVLDHDDRVVDEDADREDEREQADAIDRVAHQPGGEEREQDRRRDDDEHDEPFAPADGERDQDDDGQRRQAKMKEELVRLLGRGRAVVARDADLEAARDDAAFDGFEAPQHVVRDQRPRWRPCAWRRRW